MLYFWGIQGKVWHPHYQIALKRHSSFEKGNTLNKRWPVNKPSHVAAGILSHFTAKGRVWITYSHRFQLCWYFLVGEGTGSAVLGVTAQREADNTANTGLSQFSPRSLCNKPQDFTITTRRHWESHKVTNLLAYLQKLFMQALCSWNSRTINLVTAQCVTTHPSPLPSARAVCEGDTADLRTLTHNPFLNVTVPCTVGSNLECVLKTANLYS